MFIYFFFLDNVFWYSKLEAITYWSDHTIFLVCIKSKLETTSHSNDLSDTSAHEISKEDVTNSSCIGYGLLAWWWIRNSAWKDIKFLFTIIIKQLVTFSNEILLPSIQKQFIAEWLNQYLICLYSNISSYWYLVKMYAFNLISQGTLIQTFLS